MYVVTKIKSGVPKAWLAAGCDKNYPWFTTLPECRMEFPTLSAAVEFSKGLGKNIGLQEGESVQIEEETVRKLASIRCGEDPEEE